MGDLLAEIQVLKAELAEARAETARLSGQKAQTSAVRDVRQILRDMRLARGTAPPLADWPDEFVYVHDRAGYFIELDETALDLYGRADTAVRDLNVLDIVGPEFRRLMEQNIQNGFANVGATNKFAMRTLTTKGDSVWLEVTAHLDGEEGSRRVRGVARIIDTPGPEYRRFKRAVRGAGFGLWDRDMVTDRIWVNNWLKQMIGIAAPYLTRDELHAAIHPDDREKVLEALVFHVQKLTDQYECVYRIMHKDEQKYHWVQSRGSVTRNPQGLMTHISGSMLDITARKEAESLFELLVETDQNMIFVKDVEGRFHFINHALARLYGTTPENAYGKTDEYFCATKKQIARFHEHDRKVLNGEYLRMPVHECVRDAEGSFRWYRTRKVKLEIGGQPALLGVATEVTDLVKARRRTKRQRTLLNAVMNLVPIIIDCKDRAGNYTLVNQAFLDFVGRRSPADVKGLCVSDLLPAEEAKCVLDADKAIVSGEHQAAVEVSIPDQHGRTRVLRITKLPLVNSRKGIVGVLSVAQDVTDQKEQLNKEQDRFRRIAEFARVGIFEADARGQTLWINPEGKALEELEPDEDPSNWDKHLDEGKKEQVLQAWAEFVGNCLNSPDPAHHEMEIEEVFRTKDGQQRFLQVLVRATRSAEGTLSGFVGTFKDITDIKRMMEALGITLRAIEHDINNSVRALEALFDRFGTLAVSGPDQALIEAGRHSVKALEDLGKMARRQTGLGTDDEEFALLAAVRSFEIVNMARKGMAEKPAIVTVDPLVPERVIGPRVALMHVLQNLLKNAANRDDVSRPMLSATFDRRDATGIDVRFVVEDDGNGLSDDEFKRITEKFLQPPEALERYSHRWSARSTESAYRSANYGWRRLGRSWKSVVGGTRS